MRCADVGCGSGDVARELARIVGPTGSVTGFDMDAVKLERARAATAGLGLANVAFVTADVTALDVDTSTPSARASCCGAVSDPAALVRGLYGMLRPGGVVVVEDADFDVGFIEPPSSGAAFFLSRYATLLRAHGGDPTIGRRLHALVRAAGFEHVEVDVVQRVYLDGDEKRLHGLTLDAIAGELVEHALATPPEIEAALDDLERAAGDPDALVGLPSTFGVVARRPPVAGLSTPTGAGAGTSAAGTTPRRRSRAKRASSQPFATLELRCTARPANSPRIATTAVPAPPRGHSLCGFGGANSVAGFCTAARFAHVAAAFGQVAPDRVAREGVAAVDGAADAAGPDVDLQGGARAARRRRRRRHGRRRGARGVGRDRSRRDEPRPALDVAAVRARHGEVHGAAAERPGQRRDRRAAVDLGAPLRGRDRQEQARRGAQARAGGVGRRHRRSGSCGSRSPARRAARAPRS